MFNTIGVRTNVYNETFLSESDQDANSALTELDKGENFAEFPVQPYLLLTIHFT